LDKKCKSVSFLGEFIDNRLEREYFNYEISNAIRFIKPIMLAMAILYLLFIIPDYYLIKNNNTFKNILLNRCILVILIVLFYVRVKYFKDYWIFSYWITVYEIFCFFSFLLIFIQYENPNFLIQSFGMIIVMLVVFLVPNRWINKVAVSFLISSSFFILSLSVFESIPPSQFSAAVVYTLLAIILNSIASWQTNYYRRIQYLNEKKLTELSTTDTLTQIFNRLKFDEELQIWINHIRRYDADLSIIMFDIDDFKKINDNFGHLIGDKVLIRIAQSVKSNIRETDIFARWGGEEFVILLPNTNTIEAFEVAGKIKLIIDSLSFGAIGNITCSFGVTSFCNDDDINSFIHRADQLLYKAKQMGKNIIRTEEELCG